MRETKIYKCKVCGHVHDEEYDGWLEDHSECPSCGSNIHESYKEIK